MPDPITPAAAPVTEDPTPAPDLPGRSSIPSHVPDPTPAPDLPELSALIPADYKDREYLKDIKDVPSLFKKLDESQKLIGKRPAGIPQDNAKPEEIAAFNKAFGVPDKSEAYELVVPEKGAMPKELIEGVKGVFHKAGLSAKQAKAVSEGWNALLAEQAKAAGAAAQQQDVNFDELATETFGERKVEALAQSKSLLEKYVPEKFKPMVNELPNDQLIILSAVLDGIRKDYISEDQIPRGGGKPAGSFESQREEARKLMSTDAYRDPFHPDHASTKAKVDRIYNPKG